MLVEKQIDLFKEIELGNCCIFHCISADKAMGKGIAKPMNTKFHIRENWPLRGTSWAGYGFAVITPKNIFNLVTKEKYWHKPTYETLKQSLESAKKYLDDNPDYPKKLVMPKIGCGLDKLSWNKVKSMIEEIFKDYDVIVCYL